jgi:hypothetical protein
VMSSATFRSHREAGRVVVTVAGEVDMASLHQARGHAGLVGSDAQGARRLAPRIRYVRGARRSHNVL